MGNVYEMITLNTVANIHFNYNLALFILCLWKLDGHLHQASPTRLLRKTRVTEK